jgi:hypothetical protein
MSPRLYLALTAIAAAFAAIALLLMPNPGTRNAAPVHVSEAAHTVHAGGTAVSSTIDSDQATPADAAFLTDLFDGATDYTPEQADALTYTAHRICDLLAHPEEVPPGAERPTREAVLASLTAPGPHSYTADEAVKIVDTAEAAYCPEMLTEAYPGVSGPVPAPSPAATATAPAAAPVTAAPSPAAQPGPVAMPTPEAPIAEQLPEEAIGGARCDSDGVVTAVDADGAPVC